VQLHFHHCGTYSNQQAHQPCCRFDASDQARRCWDLWRRIRARGRITGAGLGAEIFVYVVNSGKDARLGRKVNGSRMSLRQKDTYLSCGMTSVEATVALTWVLRLAKLSLMGQEPRCRVPRSITSALHQPLEYPFGQRAPSSI
jgi:hypothetical protein